MYIRVEDGVPCGSPQTFEEVPSGWVEFVPTSSSVDLITQTVAQTYDAELNQVIETVVDLANPTDLILHTVRITRDRLLSESDWTQLPDVFFNAGVKQSWITYRTALRNVPATNSSVTSIDDVVWPTPPS